MTEGELTRREVLAGVAGIAGTILAPPAFAGPSTAAGEPARPAPHEAAATPAPDGWSPASPRDESRPAFVIRADGREGLDGCWTRTFPVAGGRHYRFSALYRTDGVEVPRRSVVAKLNWRDARGRPVPLDEPAVQGILPGMTPMAE